MPIIFPSDLSEDSWTQFVARLLSADTAGGKPLRDLLSTLPREGLPSMGSDWTVYTDHDRKTYIAVGQLDILMESPVLRIIIENKVSAPLGRSQLRKYADQYEAGELRDDVPNLYLYLSPEVRKATDPSRRWIPISYSYHVDAILKGNLHLLQAEWGQIPGEFWDTFETLKACRVRGGTKLKFPPGYDYKAKREEWMDEVDSELRETVDLFLNMLLREYQVTKDTVISSPIAIVGKFTKDGAVKEVRLLKEGSAFLATALRKVQAFEEVDIPPALGIYVHTPLPIDDTPFRDYAHRYRTASGFVITRNSLGFLDDFLDFCGVPPLRWSAEA